MGWKHLNAELETEKIDESIRGIIQGMAGGNAAHQADALRVGLYGAFQRKGATNHPFAQLRCTTKGCTARQSPVSYLSLGSSTGCTKHAFSWSSSTTPRIMECSECGHPRTDHYTWCKGCRRMFG